MPRSYAEYQRECAEMERNNRDAYYAYRDRCDDEQREIEEAKQRARRQRNEPLRKAKASRSGDEGFSELFSFLGFCIVGAIAITKFGSWTFNLQGSRETLLYVVSFFSCAMYAARYTYRATMAFNLLMTLSIVGGGLYFIAWFARKFAHL